MPAYEYVHEDCTHEFLGFFVIKEFKAESKIKNPRYQSHIVEKKSRNSWQIGDIGVNSL